MDIRKARTPKSQISVMYHLTPEEVAAVLWEGLHFPPRRKLLEAAKTGHLGNVSQHFVRNIVSEQLTSYGSAAVRRGRTRTDYSDEMKTWCTQMVIPVYFPGGGNKVG